LNSSASSNQAYLPSASAPSVFESPCRRRVALSSCHQSSGYLQRRLSHAMAEDIRRRRAACDRCHSQKVRCPKAPSQDICDRCTKARTPCIFSPFRQKKAYEADETSKRSPVTPGSSPDDQTPESNTTLTHRKRQRHLSPRVDEEEFIGQ